MGELAYMDRTGDTKLHWTAGVLVEVEAARKTFDTLRNKGYAAYKLIGDGTKGEQLLAFDATAERIIMSPAMQGG